MRPINALCFRLPARLALLAGLSLLTLGRLAALPPPPGGGGGGGGDDLSLGANIPWSEKGLITTGSGYDMRSGKMVRTIQDLVVAGSVGVPLHQTRTCFTYAEDSTTPMTQWQLSPYDYKVTTANSSLVAILYPDGTEMVFGVATGDGVTSLRPQYGSSDRVKVNGSGALTELWLGGGERLRFSGTRPYEIADANGLVTTLSFGAHGITDVTDASGRWLHYDYYTVGALGPVVRKVTASDGQWVQYDWASASLSAVITAATYNDGTTASYTYNGYGLPDVFRDTRALANMQAVRTVFSGTAVGTFGVYYALAVAQEKNPDTGDVVSSRLAPPNAPSTYTNWVPFTENTGDGRLREFRYNVRKLVGLYDSTTGTATFSHDTLGFLTQTTDPASNAFQCTNDTVLHRPKRLTFPDTNYVEVTFTNTAHPYFVATRRDERANVTTFTRFGNGVIQRIDYPDGSYETWSNLNAFNQPTEHRLRNGATEWWEYDSAGRLLKHWLPSFSGQVSYTGYTYYGSGHAWRDRVQTERDPLGHLTTFEYDLAFSGGVQGATACAGRGLVTKIINPDSTFRKFAYDVYGNKVWEENELGQRTNYAYDAYRRLTTATDPLNHTTTNNYVHYRPNDTTIAALAHTSGLPGTVTTATGRVVRAYYDGAGRKLKEIAAQGTGDAATTTYAYNNLGLLVTLSQQVNGSTWRTTTYDYDNRYRQRHAYAPLSRTTEWQYDAAGNVTKVINPDGTFSTKAYDSMNRVYSATDEMNYTVGTSYNAGGLVDTITDRKGYHYRYEYDAAGRKTKLWYPYAGGADNGSFEQWVYAADGRVDDYYNRAGQHLHYTYDNRRRETYRAWDGGAAPSVTTGYDNASRVTSRSNSTGTLGYGYDTAGRLTSETQAVSGGPTVTVGFGYDNDNLRTTRDATGESQLGFGYNARLQPTAVNYPGLAFGYQYDLAGARTLRTSPNGTASSYGYDGAGRLNLLDSYRVAGHANILRQDFGYDVRDRRTWSLRDTGSGDTYGYQADSQLTAFRFGVWRPDLYPNGSPAVLDTYAYDQNGNRTGRNEGGAVTNYTPNALNEYSAVSGASIAHSDGRGNVTTWQGWSYVYDAENRLVSATASGQSFAFAYDAQGRLAKLVKNGAAEYRYFDGAQLFLRKDAGGTVLERVLWGPSPDETLARWTPAQGWLYYHHDPLNSTLAVTDGSGNAVERYLYDAFGGTTIYDGAWGGRSGSAIANAWTYTGQEWMADLGLHNYKNRFYHDDLGRFLQQDPLRFDAGDFNLYRYCGNNGINGADPTGLMGAGDSTPVNKEPIQLPKMVVRGGNPFARDMGEFLWLAAYGRTAPNSTATQGQMIWDPNLKGYVRMNGNVMTSVFGEGSGRIAAEEATKSWATFAATEGISGLLGRAFSAVRGWFSSSAQAEREAGALAPQGLPTKCFPAGTKVSTPSGDVNIEDIKVGDVVYACDLQTGETVERNVTELLHNFTYHWVDVQVGSEVIRATRSHPFWVESERDWVEAADLKNGMIVRLENGRSAAITSVSMIDLQQPQPTYNLEVAVNHDYFVSSLHVLVHNGDGSYTITFASGQQYVGKGDMSRMADSAARLSAQTGDRVVSTQWTPANGTADSFVQEEMRMRAAGGPGGSTYNQINSPGNNIAGANGCP